MTMTRRRLLDDTFKKSVVGNPAIATDSLARMYPGIVMNGWTTQDGTPTPETPVPIVSAGNYDEASGEYKVDVELGGAQLLNLNDATLTGCTLVDDKNGAVKSNLNNQYYCEITIDYLNEYVIRNKGNYLTFSCVGNPYDRNISILIFGERTSGAYYQESNAQSNKITVKVSDDFETVTSVVFRFNRDSYRFTDKTTEVTNLMVNYGSVALPYQPYHTPQTVTLTADRPLTKWDKLEKRGGQWGWVYKHVLYDDFSELNIGQDQVSGVNRFGIHDYMSKGVVIQSGSVIEGTKKIMVSNLYRPIYNQMDVPGIAGSTTQPRLWVMDDSISSVEEFRQKASELGLVIYAETAEETFVPLSTSEQGQMNELYTFRPTTVLSNDAGCNMELTYKTKKSLEVAT